MNDNFVEGTFLRIFVGEADMVDGLPFFEKIITLAKERGIAGAMVVRGIESFGQAGTTHTARLLRLAEDLPIVIEIAERPEKVEAFLPVIDELFEKSGCGGVVTTEKVEIKRYKSTR